MRLAFLFIMVIVSFTGHAQFTDRYWCFGDSAAINFQNLANPVPAQSVLRARGSCASICDSTGTLLFYAASPYAPYWQSGLTQMGYILSDNDSLMQNGDSIKTTLWYQEMIIIPNPGNPNQFYLFHIGVTTGINPGLYYSMVDLSYNSGLGRVIQKNVQLQNVEMSDGLAAIKHGNGRDWWIVSKRWDNSNNEFILYLISSTGISGPIIQNSGALSDAGFLRIEFSNDGHLIAVISFLNLIELHSFNRCTGQISLSEIIESEYPTAPYPGLWSCAFSPDNSRLYVSSIYNGQNQDSSFLFQYDLTATNISASKDTLFLITAPIIAGLLQPGPDDKIYMGSIFEGVDCSPSWLYCDTTTFPEIMNLSVINQPDSLGNSCDFQPFSFNLGGHRTYVGLPNNPNYELGPWINSICDTLVGIPLVSLPKASLFINPNPAEDEIWINAQNLIGQRVNLSVYNQLGQRLLQKEVPVYGGYLNTQLNIAHLPPAVYFVSLESGEGRIVEMIVKQ